MLQDISLLSCVHIKENGYPVRLKPISSSLSHWSPYIIESNHEVQVLTDSLPCVQAFNKLCRGEFSSSARISSFLSVLGRYKISLQYTLATVTYQLITNPAIPPKKAVKYAILC